MEKFRTITREDLKAMMDRGEDFVLIDTLGEESYREFHLPNAVSIDAHKEDFVREVEKRAPDKTKTVIVYCASFSCQLSPRAAQMLADAGYANVLDFEGGIADWRDAGYPFADSKAKMAATAR